LYFLSGCESEVFRGVDEVSVDGVGMTATFAPGILNFVVEELSCGYSSKGGEKRPVVEV